MSNDSIALSMSPEDRTAFTVLSRAAEAINRAYTLAEQVETLTSYAERDADTIATLTEAKHYLEAQLAEIREALTASRSREEALRTELAATKSELTNEQLLSGQHWSDLQIVRAKLNSTEYTLAETSIDRDDTKAALAEAADKLARFRDILGVSAGNPEPIPAVVPTPEPVAETPKSEVIELPYCWSLTK